MPSHKINLNQTSIAQYLVLRQSPFRDWPHESPPLSPSNVQLRNDVIDMDDCKEPVTQLIFQVSTEETEMDESLNKVFARAISSIAIKSVTEDDTDSIYTVQMIVPKYCQGFPSW